MKPGREQEQTIKALAFIAGMLLVLVAVALWTGCHCACTGGTLAPLGTKVTKCIETPDVGALCMEVETEGCVYP